MSRQSTFLLADDDSDDRELFKLAMEIAGPSIQCEFVKNGLEALKQIQQGTDSFDLIFLDLNMPVMSGWGVLEKLGKANALSTPVIIYSTSSLESDIKRAKLLGAKCFLVKPDTFPELVNVLSLIIERLNIGGFVPMKRSPQQKYLECFG